MFILAEFIERQDAEIRKRRQAHVSICRFMMPCRLFISPLVSHFTHHVHDFLQRMEANQKKMDEELTFTPRIAGAKTDQKVSPRL